MCFICDVFHLCPQSCVSAVVSWNITCFIPIRKDRQHWHVCHKILIFTVGPAQPSVRGKILMSNVLFFNSLFSSIIWIILFFLIIILVFTVVRREPNLWYKSMSLCNSCQSHCIATTQQKYGVPHLEKWACMPWYISLPIANDCKRGFFTNCLRKKTII